MAAAFGTVLLDLAHASGPALYHCSEGDHKSAAWTSRQFLQTIAGVPQATVVRDYLASNSYFGQRWVQQQWLTETGSPHTATTYGSTDAYLMQVGGPQTRYIYVLRAKTEPYYAQLPDSGYLHATCWRRFRTSCSFRHRLIYR